jgi:transcriptional regulator with XRE-family HTH domain
MDAATVRMLDIGLEAIGNAVRGARGSKGYCMRETARLISLSPGTLSRVERGEIVLPVADYSAICDVLGMPLQALLAPIGGIGAVTPELIAEIQRQYVEFVQSLRGIGEK